MLTETFQERLDWLHPDHYEYSNSRVIVRETLQGGEAEVTCYVSNNALRINLGERNRLHYLTFHLSPFTFDNYLKTFKKKD
ncbi:MAG: hypothetical protein GY795_28840 [Desulfobacterales bacterium]|nr:hypothetical protein [Desulfobacterales bacterium]